MIFAVEEHISPAQVSYPVPDHLLDVVSCVTFGRRRK